MGAPCALCKGKNPHRTHVFPQNSRAELQLKWVKALGLPQKQEDAVLAEMRQMEQKGSRPRWCTFHFEYDSSDIHFPKYFDPEEGKAAHGWKEEDEEEGPSTTGDAADSSRDRSSTPNERRKSSRKRTAAPASASPSTSETPQIDISLQKILADAGIVIPGITDKEETPKPSPSTTKKREEKATSVEKTLQNILMGAGLPVPETLQAKTGVIVEEANDTLVVPPPRPYIRETPIRAAAVNSMQKTSSNKVSEARRLGIFPRSFGITQPGGSTLAMPKQLTNPITSSRNGGEYPKVILAQPAATRLPVSVYNHHTMEKYDDTDRLRHFKMPCKDQDCRSELTVIMNRARALEDHFDELSNNVLRLVQMYKTKAPQAYRPPQSLATIQGRAAAVAGPVNGRSLLDDYRVIPSDSLAVQERRVKRMGLSSKKEPERLLTDDDLASTVRRRIKEEQSSADDEDESTEKDEESADEEEYRPSLSKRGRVESKGESTSSDASPPRLDMIQ